MIGNTKVKQTPKTDAWEAYIDVVKHGKPVLSSIEFTTTNLCNMRCAHCAVGYNLALKDPDPIPLEFMLKKLDEVETLRTISITGGEPMLNMKLVRNYVLPLLKYAHERGIYTQINSNLTLDIERYKLIAPYLDVLHISHNWTTVDEFVDVGFAVMDRKPSREQREALFNKMISNSKALSEMGVMVSAETMINSRTIPHLAKIHKQVVEEMGCSRHEIHPMYDSGFAKNAFKDSIQDSLHSMYPADFASALESASLPDTRQAIHDLLDVRDENVWMLFGTLPFYACSELPEDRALLKRLHEAKNVTVRNDPDGRSRLNTNIFDGQIIVTDFGDELGTLGTLYDTSFQDAYEAWTNSSLNATLSCHCPAVKCLGPNALVKQAYYPEVNFRERVAEPF